MKCKKLLMAIAAILILIFHFWMPLTASTTEANIYKSTYLGVDIFFFVSAYSLSQRKHICWLRFISNRLLYVYVPFAVMCLIAAFYKGWTLKRLFSTLLGVSFFVAGGGSFLWFAIAIMLVYMVAPGMLVLREKVGYWSALLVIIAWLGLVCVLQFVVGSTTIFILVNRIPIMLVGFFFDDFRKKVSSRYTIVGILVGLIAGAFIVYEYCGNIRLNKPIVEIYYILVMPFTVALIMFIDYISTKVSFSCKPLEFIGGFTLEIYGMQMIFGYNIEKALFKILKDVIPLIMAKIVTFILTACVIIFIAWVFSLPKKYLGKIRKR